MEAIDLNLGSRLKGFCLRVNSGLWRGLYTLTISQIVAVMFIFGSLLYEAFKDCTIETANGKIEYIFILIIYLVTGFRIFLTNWEVEEDPATGDLKNAFADTEKMRKEWWLRFSWVFLVYLFPFIVSIEDIEEKKKFILGSLSLVFIFMVLWDWYILKRLFGVAKNNRFIFSPGSKIETDDVNFLDVISYSLIKGDFKVKNLEHKIKLWFFIEGASLIFSLFSFISLVFESVLFGYCISFLAILTIILALVDYVANFKEYIPRFILCLLLTLPIAYLHNMYYKDLKISAPQNVKMDSIK